MAKLDSVCSIELVTVYEDENTRYYRPFFEKRWNELKEELKNFGISFSSLYDIEFSGSQYKLAGQNQHFGARDVYVYYDSTCVAKAYISGSNFCDREGRLDIYLSKLKSVYIK